MANGHSLPGRPMRTLAVNTFISLDGVMQAPGGPEEDPTGGVPLGGRGGDDLAGYVAKLKREDGPEVQVHGSPGLIQTLLEHDLIDEFRLWIFPVVIGTGKRFFGDGAIPAALKLVDSKVSKTGVTMNTYERAGEIESGSMDFDEPTDAEIERRRRLTGR